MQDMMTDRVTLVKADGTVFRKDIAALVTAGQVTTWTPDLPVEVGDHILRQLPSGLVEDYVVKDPRFYDALGMGAHFQIKVQRSTAPTAEPATVIQNITNHFHGPNARVNYNSTDNSTNIVNTGPTIEQLRDFVTKVSAAKVALPEPQQTEIATPIALLEDEIRSGNPSPLRVTSALQSLKTVAEGAAGGIVADGIVAMVGSLLGN